MRHGSLITKEQEQVLLGDTIASFELVNTNKLKLKLKLLGTKISENRFFQSESNHLPHILFFDFDSLGPGEPFHQKVRRVT